MNGKVGYHDGFGRIHLLGLHSFLARSGTYHVNVTSCQHIHSRCLCGVLCLSSKKVMILTNHHIPSVDSGYTVSCIPPPLQEVFYSVSQLDYSISQLRFVLMHVLDGLFDLVKYGLDPCRDALMDERHMLVLLDGTRRYLRREK